MENPHAENMKSAVGSFVRGTLSIIAVLLFLLFGSMIQKCSQENVSTYESVEEILEKNYHSTNARVLNVDEYYYLLLGSKEELIHFADGKYFAFDKIKQNFGNVGSGTALAVNEEIGATYMDIYSYEEDIIITVWRMADEETVGIRDNYGRWKAALVNNKLHYMAVRSKDHFTDDYQLTASSKDGEYDIGKWLIYRIEELD